MQAPPGVLHPWLFAGSGDAAVPQSPSLDGLGILVAEDDLVLAYRIERAIMDAGGIVVGPATTVSDALRLINVERVDGAILDSVLHREVSTLVAERLSERDVPFVFHADVRLPDELAARFPAAPVCLKPLEPAMLVDCFADYLVRKLFDADRGGHQTLEQRPAI